MSDIGFDSESIPEEFKEYIFFNFGSYAVKNDRNSILITFGRFSSKDVACAAVKLLIKYDWDILNIGNDLVSDYHKNFYVFKLKNNNLIFDLKFASYDEAIEYLEISSQCNDYHNEILYKKKRKAKYENSLKIQLENKFEEDIDIPNIYFKNDLYVVKYESNGKEYGFFHSIEEAIVAKNLLIENNWKFSNLAEMKFYDSIYWVFKIDSNVIFFIDKFESYEDALDCLDLVKSYKYDFVDPRESIKKMKNKYNSVSKPNVNTKKSQPKSIQKPKGNSKKSKSNVSVQKSKNKSKRIKSKIPKNQFYKVRTKHKFSHDNIIIRKVEEINKKDFNISPENIRLELNIIKFKDNTLMDYYSIFISTYGGIEVSSNINELNEFDYIWNMLIIYGWDLDKINKISSIHYFNNFYYIIKSFNDKLIVSGPFNSYDEAEDNIGFLYGYYSKDDGEKCRNSIKKHGDYYKFIEKHGENTFEIAYQKSLETLKAIIDIFEYYNWDSDEFSDFNIYYYHGLYWEIDYFNYYIKLYGKFNSKKAAIEHKTRLN